MEELIRAMMDDGQIHNDVVTKLWHVYSKLLEGIFPYTLFDYTIIGSDKPLPRNQRRGAIIILGMLAVARRHIVTERVDVLLRVGLGPLGKVDIFSSLEIPPVDIRFVRNTG